MSSVEVHFLSQGATMQQWLNVPFFLLLAAEIIFGTTVLYTRREYASKQAPTSESILLGTFFLIVFGRAYAPQFFGHLTKWADFATFLSFGLVTETIGWFKEKEKKYEYPFFTRWTHDVWHSPQTLFFQGILTIMLGAGLHYFRNQAMTANPSPTPTLLVIEAMLYLSGCCFIAAALLWRRAVMTGGAST